MSMTSLSLRLPFLLIALLALGACASASKPSAPMQAMAAEQLRHQAEAWDEAIVGKDTAAIAANMSEDFLQIDSAGGVHDKAAFIALLTSPRLVIAPYTVDGLQIRIHGTAALVTGRTRMHGSWDGKPFESDYRYTDVYVREGDAWRVANVQITEVARSDGSD